MVSFNIITPPSTFPVTLALVKLHLRLTTTTDDDYLNLLIAAASDYVEQETRRALCTQTIEAFFDAPKQRVGGQDSEWWDGIKQGSIISDQANYLELPRPNLQSITEIVSYDDSDNETVFAASNYYADTSAKPGRVVLRPGSIWPVGIRNANGIKVTYEAGYGDADTDVPALLRQAMLEIVGEWYENRTSVGGDFPELPPDIEMKVRKFQIMRL